MACHELAALRLGLMNLLGIGDDAARQHELAELGDAGEAPGPLRALLQARSFAELRRSYEAALGDLAATVARLPATDPKLGYYRSLLLLTKKVELDLASFAELLARFDRDLDELHDYTHELHPPRG